MSSIFPVLVMFNCVNDCHWQPQLVGSLWKLDSVYKWARSWFCRHVSTVAFIPLFMMRLHRPDHNYISTNVKSAHRNANTLSCVCTHTTFSVMHEWVWSSAAVSPDWKHRLKKMILLFVVSIKSPAAWRARRVAPSKTTATPTEFQLIGDLTPEQLQRLMTRDGKVGCRDKEEN